MFKEGKEVLGVILRLQITTCILGGSSCYRDSSYCCYYYYYYYYYYLVTHLTSYQRKGVNISRWELWGMVPQPTQGSEQIPPQR